MAVEITRDGKVTIVTMARPEALNAFNSAQLEELVTAFHNLRGDSATRAYCGSARGTF